MISAPDIFSRITLNMNVSGTASNIPAVPHMKDQNTNPKRTETVLIENESPIHRGSTTLPIIN